MPRSPRRSGPQAPSGADEQRRATPAPTLLLSADRGRRPLRRELLMTPEQAWERIRTAPDDEHAWRVVYATAQKAAKSSYVPREHAEDALGMVLARLHETARNRRLPAIEKSVFAYVVTSIRRKSIDLCQRDQRTAPVTPPPRPHPRDFLHVLEAHVVPVALGLREPWRQEGAEADWKQLRRLLVGSVTLPKLLWGSNAPPAKKERDAILAATYKRHERIRSDLYEAIGILEQSSCDGHIDTNTAKRYRWMVAGLRRRRTASWYEGAAAFTKSLA